VTEVSAIICAYGDQPHLADAVAALRASRDVGVEIIVVDNGSPDTAGLSGVTVIRPGRNTGFAGGCNLGARAATGQTLVFVNSDAIVEPDCLAVLHREVRGLLCATVVLADEPQTVNSWGNPVHLLGFSWAGGYGHPVTEARSGPVASVTGALFAVPREAYLGLGGMDEEYFTYGEDVDLSLRALLAGLPVAITTDAVAAHHYDFSRNEHKMYLLERNRLITVLTTYQGRTLLALAPLILAAEAALTLSSIREGWWEQKRAGWVWLASNRRYLRRRRNRIQGSRRLPDRALLQVLSVDLNPPRRFQMGVSATSRRFVRGYWEYVGRRLSGA
jgi:GT2 family glycosyltransferase